MRVASITALAAFAAGAPAAAQTFDKQRLAYEMLEAGVNCPRVLEIVPQEPTHYGDVLKVVCEAETWNKEKRQFTFRVTLRLPSGKDIEPWK
jgi:hypothetical protein